MLRMIPSAPQMLSTSVLPPEFGAVVRPFFSSMLHLDTDARVALVSEEYGHLREKLVGQGAAAAGQPGLEPGGTSLASDAAELAEGAAAGEVGPSVRSREASLQSEVSTLLAQAQGVLQKLAGPAAHQAGQQAALGQQGQQAQRLPQRSSSSSGGREAGNEGAIGQAPAGAATAEAGAAEAGPSGGSEECMVLMTVLLCTLLRGARLQGHKVGQPRPCPGKLPDCV